ncbi:sodium-independent anion transporter [Candidatus Gracilibacteria bacterium]|nr:MAG: sodium-independent anion transporter [Candidatus Gracilibacteria bacterium]PIE85783.1 MAG: sodium-independent anion transporter [Candidatus Gracilibacteria bacterium]
MTKILKKLSNYFPFFNWIIKLKDKKVIKSDLIAGITLALVMIPQSMAYASIAGLPIYIGLYTAFIPTIIGALFGSSWQMSTGPVTIISLMTAATLEPIATSGVEGYIVYASILAMIIGFFYIFLGLLKLGVIVDFLSHPVIIGFTNGVAIITITSQLKKIFGITVEKGNNYLDTLHNTFESAINSAHEPTLMIGIGSVLVLLILVNLFPKLPRVLIVLIIFITISKVIDFEGLGGNVVGKIPEGLPNIHIPKINIEIISDLILSAIIIALIGFTETVAVAKALATKTKQRVSANKELLGQGFANIASSLSGGYGVAGSFSRSAVNIRAGAVTPLSSIISGIMVGITLLFLTPLLYHLPQATLAAIIIVAVSALIKVKPIIKAYNIQKSDGVIAFLTFVLTLIFSPNIENGLIIGVMLSLLVFVYKSMRPRLVEVGLYKDNIFRDTEIFGLKKSPDISVFMFDGTLFFANAGYFESKILEFISSKDKVKIVIFDMLWLTDIDSSGQEVFENLINRLEKYGIEVYICSLRVKVIQKFIKTGYIKKFGKKKIFVKLKDVISYLDEEYGDEIDLKPLLKYSPDKNVDVDLEKFIVKKFEKWESN